MHITCQSNIKYRSELSYENWQIPRRLIDIGHESTFHFWNLRKQQVRQQQFNLIFPINVLHHLNFLSRAQRLIVVGWLTK